jgi:hypothetical protein
MQADQREDDASLLVNPIRWVSGPDINLHASLEYVFFGLPRRDPTECLGSYIPTGISALDHLPFSLSEGMCGST